MILNSLTASIRKNKTGMLIMVFSALFSSFGQFLWKEFEHTGGGHYLFLLAGFALYGLGAVCMIAAFRFGSFSVLHPMQSLSYIFALIIGFAFLNEAITATKAVGLAIILFGVVMIGVGDE
ncbi:MAG TPA: EamA family transporter [Clostridia bacterium]|nr:EamA family transporter [Clostridia bacterium]